MYQILISRTPWLAMFMCLLAVIRALFIWYFLRNSIRTTGTVVEIETDASGDTTPIVEFKTTSGAPITFRVTTQLGKERWDKGTEWPVRYLPNSPKGAQIDTPHYRWSIVFIFLLAAFLLSLLSLVARFFPAT